MKETSHNPLEKALIKLYHDPTTIGQFNQLLLSPETRVYLTCGQSDSDQHELQDEHAPSVTLFCDPNLKLFSHHVQMFTSMEMLEQSEGDKRVKYCIVAAKDQLLRGIKIRINTDASPELTRYILKDECKALVSEDFSELSDYQQYCLYLSSNQPDQDPVPEVIFQKGPAAIRQFQKDEIARQEQALHDQQETEARRAQADREAQERVQKDIAKRRAQQKRRFFLWGSFRKLGLLISVPALIVLYFWGIYKGLDIYFDDNSSAKAWWVMIVVHGGLLALILKAQNTSRSEDNFLNDLTTGLGLALVWLALLASFFIIFVFS